MQDRYKTFELLIHHKAAIPKCSSQLKRYKKCNNANTDGMYEGYRQECLQLATEVNTIYWMSARAKMGIHMSKYSKKGVNCGFNALVRGF